MTDCAKWLQHYLRTANSAVLVDTVRAKARALGFTRGQLKLARDELEIITLSASGVGGSYSWRWKLP